MFLHCLLQAVRQCVREKIRPFPTEQTLQENLQREVNWDSYRKDVVDDLVLQHQEAHDLVPLVFPHAGSG